MNILLTGCAGFIGAQVASLLLDGGHEVVGVDALYASHASRLQEWRLGNLADKRGFTFHRVDIRDIEAARRVFAGCGQPGRIAAVVNLGALAGIRHSVEEPRSYYEVNMWDPKPAGTVPGIQRRQVHSWISELFQPA